MAIDALALVGFMDQRVALEWLAGRCEPPIPAPAVLLSRWHEAKKKRGKPMPQAGCPKYRDIPPEHTPYTEQVKQSPRYEATVGSMTTTFKIVELAPLLAFQFHVEIDRATRICSALSKPPPMKELLELCLPLGVRDIQIEEPVLRPDSVVVKATDSAFRPIRSGVVGNIVDEKLHAVGVLLGEASPLVQVVKYEDRCYLKNGYHRAYGLRMAEQTEMPCLFLETDDPACIEIPPQGAFSLGLLRSNHPPTCGHFTEELAWPVRVRELMRAYRITWTDCSYLM
jgi:hypothetical protein